MTVNLYRALSTRVPKAGAQNTFPDEEKNLRLPSSIDFPEQLLSDYFCISRSHRSLLRANQ